MYQKSEICRLYCQRKTDDWVWQAFTGRTLPIYILVTRVSHLLESIHCHYYVSLHIA